MRRNELNSRRTDVFDRFEYSLMPIADNIILKVFLQDHRAMSWAKTSSWKAKTKAKLRARDGENCWLCARPIKAGAGSIEHLIARINGGSDEIGNLVLCHRGCNTHLADRTVEKKIKMRIKWHRTFVT